MVLGQLHDAVRRDYSEPEKRKLIARLNGRLYCVVQAIPRLSHNQSMMDKYPNLCIYCKSKPCTCSETRLNVAAIAINHNEEQRGWSVRQYQTFSEEEYGALNQERGFDYALGRTFKELNEVKMASEAIDRGEIPVKTAVREFGLEVADVQMWLLGLANILRVDTQKAMLERYWPHCHKCSRKRCICGPKEFTLA